VLLAGRAGPCYALPGKREAIVEVSIGLVVGFLAVLAAGVVQGLTGFGFSLMTVPVLVLFLPPAVAVPVVLLLSCLVNVVLIWGARGHVRPGRFWPLTVAGVAMLPVGTLALKFLDPDVLRLGIGIAILVFAVALLRGFRRPVAGERAGLAAVGALSGLLNGAVSTGGPPVILFLTNQGEQRDSFRANLIAYFLILNLATIPPYLVGGLIDGRVLAYAAGLVPALGLGALVGSRLVRRTEEEGFRKVALLVVMAAGTLAVLSGLGVM
jgi:hypothetical protein